MSSRFDHRSKDTFKKDIYFGTMIEKYFFNKWRDLVNSKDGMSIDDWDDNGCGNDGQFIASGNTAGADYKISASFNFDKEYIELVDMPLEIKWVPTAGKFTLKENDLKAYLREGAHILFIYNSVRCGTDMRKPKDHNLESHIKLIESKIDQIKWGIMFSNSVKKLYDYANENNLFRPINYMGGKSGIVLQQKEFNKWFTQHSWI